MCVSHTSFSHTITGPLFSFEMAWSKNFKWDSDWFSHLPAKYFYSNFLLYTDVHGHLTKPDCPAQYSTLLSGSKTKAEVTQGQMSYLANLQSIFMCHSDIGLIITKHLIIWSLSFSNISSRENERFEEPFFKKAASFCQVQNQYVALQSEIKLLI